MNQVFEVQPIHKKLILNHAALVVSVVSLIAIFVPMMHYTYINVEHPHMTINPSTFRVSFQEYLEETHPKTNRDFRVIIGIFTTPKRIYNREAARQTWLNFASNAKSRGVDLEIKFVCGEHSSYPESDLKIIEQEDPNDFLFLPVKDFYKNMPTKVLRFYEWVVAQQTAYDFVIKLDDDSFVHLDNLLDALSKLPTTRLRYGYIWYDVPKETNWSKYYDDKWQLGDYYPPYAAGPGHVISYDLAQYITMIPNPLILENDDVNVDVWLYSVDVLRIHDERWHGGYALCCKQTRQEKLDFLLLVNMRPEEAHVTYDYMTNASFGDKFPLESLSYGDSQSCTITVYPFKRIFVLLIVGLLGRQFYEKALIACRYCEDTNVHSYFAEKSCK